MAFSSDSMGVECKKPTPPGFFLDLKAYEAATDWVSRHLRTLGYEPVEARYNPYNEQWDFLDKKGVFVAKVSMDLIERILEALFALARATDRPLNGRSEVAVAVPQFQVDPGGD